MDVGALVLSGARYSIAIDGSVGVSVTVEECTHVDKAVCRVGCQG